MTSILVTSTKITTQQVVTTQVSNELNLVLDTVQRLVRDSSLIECVSNTDCSLTTGFYLKLRFQDTTLDPTCIYLSNNQILIARGPDATNNQNCTVTTQALTTNKVNVNSLTFTKFDIPGGKATVQIDATLTYNSTNPEMQVSRTLRSAIGRVSAATFDSDLLPDVTNSRNIGTNIGSKVWKNIFLSGVLGLGTATTAQETGMTATTGALYYNTTAPATVKVYNGTTSTWNDVGGSKWTTSGSNIYYNTGNVGVGTTGPGTRLEVYNASAAEETAIKVNNQASTGYAAKISIANSTNVQWDLRVGGSTRGDYANSAFAIEEMTTGHVGTRLIVKQDGNVGIGTTAPGALLQISSPTTMGTGGYALNGGTVRVFSTETATQNIGGSIVFGGATGNAVTPYAMAAIRAGKETAPGDANYAGNLQFHFIASNGASGEAMRISGTGNVTTPSQVTFEAKLCSTVVNSGSIMIWETVLTNTGNAYSNTTGKFTAPVAGTYVFGFNTLMNNAGSGEYRYEFYKNAGLYNSIIAQKAASTWQTIQGTITTYLNANDTIYINYTQGVGATYIDCSYDRFWGRLSG